MFLVTRIFTTVEVFTFLHNILVRSTRDDMFGTTYMFGIGDGVGWGGDDNILVRSIRDDMFGTTYMFGIGDGVGWGGVGMITYLCVAYVMTCSALRTCSALGVGWGGDDNILVRSTRDNILVCSTHGISLFLLLPSFNCWFHLKKFCPKQMKSRTGPTLNGRFWDRIYQWVFRHNSRK